MRVHTLPKGQSIAPMPALRVKPAMFDRRDIQGPFSLLVPNAPPKVLVGGGHMRGLQRPRYWS
jgi:hypothetical protein